MPQRRFAWPRVVVNWSYPGFSVGLLVVDINFWLKVLLVPAAATALFAAPGLIHGWVWDARLARVRPAGWSGPQAQSRAKALATSPFTLHSLVTVTEQVQGGVVCQAKREASGTEWRHQDEPVRTEQTLKALEAWVPARYRAYRRRRRQPVSEGVRPDHEVVRREEQQLGAGPRAGGADAGPVAVLMHGSHVLWVKFRGAVAEAQVQYVHQDTGAGYTRQFVYRNDDEHIVLNEADLDQGRCATVQAWLALRDSGLTVQTFFSLAAAEAGVLSRHGGAATRSTDTTQRNREA